MFKTDNAVRLISVIPYEKFLELEAVNGDLSNCQGVVEKEPGRDIWFGFVNHKPMRVTYRTKDNKTTWARCNIQMVKSKINSLRFT